MLSFGVCGLACEYDSTKDAAYSRIIEGVEIGVAEDDRQW